MSHFKKHFGTAAPHRTAKKCSNIMDIRQVDYMEFWRIFVLVLLHFMILKSAMSSVKEVKTALRKQMRTNLMGIGPEKILEASTPSRTG